MANLHTAFEKLDRVTHDDMRKGETKLVYEYVNAHMIFDIKLEGKFTRR